MKIVWLSLGKLAEHRPYQAIKQLPIPLLEEADM